MIVIQHFVQLSLGVHLSVHLPHLVRPAAFDCFNQNCISRLLATELSQVFC